jgi:hypothetical protein
MLAISLNFQQRQTGFLFQPYCQQLGDGGEPERKEKVKRQQQSSRFSAPSLMLNLAVGVVEVSSASLIGQYRKIFIS